MQNFIYFSAAKFWKQTTKRQPMSSVGILQLILRILSELLYLNWSEDRFQILQLFVVFLHHTEHSKTTFL